MYYYCVGIFNLGSCVKKFLVYEFFGNGVNIKWILLLIYVIFFFYFRFLWEEVEFVWILFLVCFI